MSPLLKSLPFPVLASSVFFPLTIYGLTASSIGPFQAAVLGLVALLSFNRSALLCVLPYIIYSPTAAMAGLPLFAIVTALLSLHALLALSFNPRMTPLNRGCRYWISILGFAFIFIAFSALLAADAPYSVVSPYVQGAILLIALTVLIRERHQLWNLAVSICLASSCAFIYKGIYFLSDAIPPLLAQVPLSEIDWQTRSVFYLDSEFVKRFLWLGQEPNYTASLHFVPIGVALALFATEKKGRWFYLLAASLNILQIFGTLSRAGTLLAFSMVILLVFQRGFSNSQRLLIGASLIALTVGMYDNMDYIFARLNTVQSSIDTDAAGGRLLFLEDALLLVGQAPFFGVGPGGFRFITGNAAHNTFAEAVVEFGFVGGFVLIFFIIFPGLCAARKWATARHNSLTISYAFYMTMGFTISFYQFYIVAFMGFLCISSASLINSSSASYPVDS